MPSSGAPSKVGLCQRICQAELVKLTQPFRPTLPYIIHNKKREIWLDSPLSCPHMMIVLCLAQIWCSSLESIMRTISALRFNQIWCIIGIFLCFLGCWYLQCALYKRYTFYICDNFVRCYLILLIFGRNILEIICNRPHIYSPCTTPVLCFCECWTIELAK